jgi:hypothetical protein
MIVTSHSATALKMPPLFLKLNLCAQILNHAQRVMHIANSEFVGRDPNVRKVLQGESVMIAMHIYTEERVYARGKHSDIHPVGHEAS